MNRFLIPNTPSLVMTISSFLLVQVRHLSYGSFIFYFQEEKEGLHLQFFHCLQIKIINMSNWHIMGVTCSEHLDHSMLYFRQVNTHYYAKFSMSSQRNMCILINLYCFLKILWLSIFLQNTCKYT